MSASQGQDRSRLDGFEIEIFKLVQKNATQQQWKKWLQAPLEHAAANGNLDLFTRLMEAGADGSAGWRGCHGRTLLGAAAFGKSEEMVHALLNAGAKPDLNVIFKGSTRTSLPRSALNVAAARGAKKAAKALMLAGANPNLGDEEKCSPLHLAAKAGHHGVVGLLLLKGARTTVKTQDERHTPLHLAALKGQTRCVSELLVGGADKNALNGRGHTPLELAVNGNHPGAVRELLGTDGAGSALLTRTFLGIAATSGHVEVLRAFLRHGGVNACDSRGYTALHEAASVSGPNRDNGDVVRALLEAGADTELKTIVSGDTPLHIAAHQQIASRGTICALLEGGANVNARDGQLDMPLHTACVSSNVGAVELLLCWGADETLTDEEGFTAEDCVGILGEEDSDNDQRIRDMLSRAPADRSWRRRGWLVLCRSYPTKVQLAKDNSSNGSSSKVAKASCYDSDGGGCGGSTRDRSMIDVVGRVVGLEAEGVFRLVVGFL